MGTLRKKLYLSLVLGFLCVLLIFTYGMLEQRSEGGDSHRMEQGPPELDGGGFSPQVDVEDEGEEGPPLDRRSGGVPQLVSSGDAILQAVPPDDQPRESQGDFWNELYSERYPSFSNLSILAVWDHWTPLVNRSDILAESRNAMKEGLLVWMELVTHVSEATSEEDLRGEEARAPSLVAHAPAANDAVKQCPYSVSSVNSTELGADEFVLEVPCGLVVDSSVTIVGIPRGVMGDFQVNLVGEKLPGEQNPPIIFHYNVRLRGDMLSNTSVMVQNSWTAEADWGEEERCPPLVEQQKTEREEGTKKVDDLSTCIEQVGRPISGRDVGDGRWPFLSGRGSKERDWFPFVEGHLFVATLRVGLEGFHMMVNGKHITSYGYRKNLEPWLVGGVQVKGDIQPSSLMVTGLPFVEELDRVADLEFLKAPLLTKNSNVSMLIGVISTSNNFDRRMAIRRSWMQAKEVRSGQVAVRFFVGLHKTKQVNKELWIEANTYGDVQLMPFIDYYNLITLKTLALCIYAGKTLNSDFVMKTDDDTFVRVDEVLAAVTAAKTSNSILYGRMEFEAKPHRSRDDKWYVSEEEFPEPKYPPWAHGPGYVISREIVDFVVKSHEERTLQIFKLEDVAMGIWIETFRNSVGVSVDYVNNDNFVHTGCADGFVIAHYRSPRQMLCMWERLVHNRPSCCR